MAGSVNKVILVGNLGRDPEVRTTKDGYPIVHLSVATSDSWKDKLTGERREKTEWNRVVIFNEKLGEIAQKYLRKAGVPAATKKVKEKGVPDFLQRSMPDIAALAKPSPPPPKASASGRMPTAAMIPTIPAALR